MTTSSFWVKNVENKNNAMALIKADLTNTDVNNNVTEEVTSPANNTRNQLSRWKREHHILTPPRWQQ